jgi:acyl-CoA thioesterase
MSLTEHAQLTRTGENTYAAETDRAYWNLIGPFGGWIAAVLLRAVLDDPRHIGDPLSISINFAGSMEEGAFAVRVREFRHNRSTTFWSSEIVQEQAGVEMLCAFATIVTARRRETPEFVDAVPPVVKPPEDLVSFSSTGSTLKFLERLEMRYVSNPFSTEDPTGPRISWTRIRDGGTLDFEDLTALCDSGLPHIFSRLKKRVPISSVTMNVFFHTTNDELARVGDDFVLSVAQMRIATRGFFDATTTMWTRSGVLLATTEQVIYFKAPD